MVQNHCQEAPAPRAGGAMQADRALYHISPGYTIRAPAIACLPPPLPAADRFGALWAARLWQALAGPPTVAFVASREPGPAAPKSLNAMIMTITMLSRKFRLTQEIRAAIMLAGLNLPELIEAKHG